MAIAKMSLTPWDYLIFAICLTISAGIGVFYRFAGGRQATTEEFLMADRQMSVFPVALSLLASFISAITLLGTPSEVFLGGTQYATLAFANVIVIPLAAHLYIPVLYKLKLTSAYEYLELRFNKATRTLATMIYALMMTMYMAIVLYSPCLALSALTGINLWLLIVIAGAICVFYTTLGGLKAVMWTDAFQVCIMYLGITFVLALGTPKIEGGFSGAWGLAQARGRIEFGNVDPSPFVRHTLWGTVIGGTFTWLAIYAVNQAQVQRCLACPSLRNAQLALWANAPGLFLFVGLTSCLGVVLVGRYAHCEPLKAGIITKKDQLLPLFVMEALSSHVGIGGLFVSCVFCGSLSTISSGLNSLAAVVLQDLIRVFIRPNLSDSAATTVSKLLVLGFGVTCIALTWVASKMGGVLSAALALFGALGGPLLGVFTLGIFVPFANAAGAFVGLIVALVLCMWIVVGANVYPPPRDILCASTQDCHKFADRLFFNESLIPNLYCSRARTPMDASDYQGLWIYRISYIWYSLLAVIIVLLVGVLVTLCSGRSRWAKPGSKFVSPLLHRFLSTEQRAEDDDEDPKIGGVDANRNERNGKINEGLNMDLETGQNTTRL